MVDLRWSWSNLFIVLKEGWLNGNRMLPILSQFATKLDNQQPVKYPIKLPFQFPRGSTEMVDPRWSWSNLFIVLKEGWLNGNRLLPILSQSAPKSANQQPSYPPILTVRPIPHVLESEYIPKQAVISTIKLTFKQPHDFPRTVPSQSVPVYPKDQIHSSLDPSHHPTHHTSSPHHLITSPSFGCHRNDHPTLLTSLT